jgi:hypothetical protein
VRKTKIGVGNKRPHINKTIHGHCIVPHNPVADRARTRDYALFFRSTQAGNSAVAAERYCR